MLVSVAIGGLLGLNCEIVFICFDFRDYSFEAESLLECLCREPEVTCPRSFIPPKLDSAG